MNHTREQPGDLRQSRKLNNSTGVVAEYDASGCVRETYYYTSDEAWLEKILERNASGGSREAS
jgi:hypothetical protein